MAAKFGVKKTFTDYRQMLADKDIDAVSIVTMWDQHTEPAVDALKAGKHVFLEKPMASTIADCKLIMAAARAKQDRADAPFSLPPPDPLPSTVHSSSGDTTASGSKKGMVVGESTKRQMEKASGPTW